MVPGVGSTIDTRRPTSLLNRLDLPTFGRPTMATVGRGIGGAILRAAQSRTGTIPAIEDRHQSRARSRAQLLPIEDMLPIEDRHRSVRAVLQDTQLRTGTSHAPQSRTGTDRLGAVSVRRTGMTSFAAMSWCGYRASRLAPVIASGFAIPMRSSTVGARSASLPTLWSLALSSPGATTEHGTK